MHVSRPALLINAYKRVSFKKRGKVLSATPILRSKNVGIEIFPDTDKVLDTLDHKLEFYIISVSKYQSTSISKKPESATDIDIDNIPGIMFAKDSSDRVSVIYSPAIKLAAAEYFNSKQSILYLIGFEEFSGTKITMHLSKKESEYIVTESSTQEELPAFISKYVAEYRNIYGTLMLNGLFYNGILFSWREFEENVKPFFDNDKKRILHFKLTSDRLLEYIYGYSHMFFDAFPLDMMSFAKHISNHEKKYAKDGIHIMHGSFFERFDIYLPNKKTYKDLGTKGIEFKLKK